MEQQSFHSRHLPHFYNSTGTFFITYRLYGTLPKDVVERMQNDLLQKERKQCFKNFDAVLDAASYGPTYLKIPEIAEVNKNSLHYADEKDYRLICFTIMSNHIHVLFELTENNKGISKIMQSLKRYSARESNKILNRTGTFWQDESYDHLVRDNDEFKSIIEYIILNPVKAGLVENWKDYPYTYLNEKYL
jgi:REP element-mobilizing transposase RayT